MIYAVGYDDNYDNYEILGFFSTEEKAIKFIDKCSEKFKIGIVGYDYRFRDLYVINYEIDRF